MFLKRTVALIIDFAVIAIVPLTLQLLTTSEAALMGNAPLNELEQMRENWHFIRIFSPYLWFVFVNGIMTGVLGYTPGKLFLNIRVATGKAETIGIGKGVIREGCKLLCLALLGTGAYFAIYGILSNGRTFYDRALRVDVYEISG